jgi:Zn-dependent alcohol dehydrogenase
VKITAAVSETKGAPFTLQERELGEPGPGDCRERLMELSLRGRFPVDRLMTFYDFDDIERAAHDAERERRLWSPS